MIDGYAEKALYLRRVQVHSKNSVRARGRYEIGNELCGNGVARARFSVLTRVTEIRNNRSNSAGTCTACRIYHNKQFHKIIVDGTACRLNKEYVFASYRFVVSYINFAVTKMRYLYFTQRCVQL